MYRTGRENASEFKLNEVFKQLVAAAIVKEKPVKDGDAVVLDAGSSATYVAEVIFSTELKNLSILTHNIDVFQKYFFGDFSKMKSKLEPLGRGYVVTTKPPKNAKSEEIKVFRDTIATLREWKIEVIEVD
jgi:hypothetical protein